METWIDFTGFQKQLDEQGAEIRAAQQAGAASRKEITAKTREFRKLDDASKLTELKSLLKLYQAEIDTLSARCKTSEACFMNAYKVLADAPDPRPLLAARDEELVAKEARIAGQAEENAELRRRLDELTPDPGENKVEGGHQMAQELEKALVRASQAESRLTALRRELQTKDVDDAPEPDMSLVGRLADRDREISELRRELDQERSEREADRAALAKLQLALDTKGSNDQPEQEQKRSSDQVSSQDEKELVSLRRKWRAAEESNAALSQRLSELEAHDERQRELVAKLEDDLANVHQNDTFSTISGWTAVPTGEMSGILAQQRDRFKVRCQELEKEQHKIMGQLQTLRKELEAVKRENGGLYERVRNLQSANVSSTIGTSLSPGGVYEDDAAVHQTLKSLEVDKASLGMNAAEAAVFRVFCRAVADRKFRYGICGYAAVIHLMLLL